MKIIIPGTPIAKNRHKCGCKGKHPFAYDPQIKAQMADIESQMLRQWTDAHLSENKQIQLEASELAKAESFYLTYVFVFPINDSETLAQKNAKLWGFKFHNKKPDVDNLEKFYSDCATGVFWKDDSQVVQCNSIKIYGDFPRTIMEILPMKETPIEENSKLVYSYFSPSELDQLADCSEFWSNAVSMIKNSSDDHTKIYFLNVLAGSLIDFASHYADKLKKIAKQALPKKVVENV